MSQAKGGTGYAGAKHKWNFFRAGGLDQVSLSTGEDLIHLEQLDQKLWVALACPTRGIEFDPKTLDLIDTDKDGRVRVPEVLAAVRWATGLLKNPGDLLKGGDLPLSAINEQTEEGAKVLAAARQILANLGKPDSTVVSVADTTDTVKIFAQTKFNGDGIVPSESAGDAETRQLIADIMATVGSKPDRSGLAGVNQELTDRFFQEAQAYADWTKKGEAPEVLPLAGNTAAAVEAIKAVRSKINDYFARCRLAAFDARATAHLNRAEAEYVALAAKNLAGFGEEIAALPLAQVDAGRPLPLDQRINPAWIGPVSALRAFAVAPVLGPDKVEITETDWQLLQQKFAAYETWQAGKQGAAVEKLGLARVQAVLTGQGRKAIAQLIAQDLALAPEFAEINTVDKLARLYRDLRTLLVNFVAFNDFYSAREKAIFQAGTLYLDTRGCDLCLAVEDIGKHSAMAGLAGVYIAYCECTRPATGEKRTIAAAFTAGDSDNLRPGRNGLFYDRQGRDWDATIVKIVEHPISIRQAALLPYKRLARFVSDQIEKFASSRDKAQEQKMAAGVADVSKSVEAGKPAAGAAPAGGMQNMLGVFALLSVAIGSLIGGLAGLLAGFLGLKWWQMPLVILAVFLAISGPSMILAYLKLRRRNLGPLLDASGWAINSRVKLTLPLGRMLTHLARLPEGAIRSLEDPYSPKENQVRNWAIFLLLLILMAVGVLVYLKMNHAL